MMSSATLDSGASGGGWTDHGPVIQSTNGSPYNAIDPSVLADEDGRVWMAFGSFWSGIYLIQLNPRNGLRLDESEPPRQLAWSESIEAACLTHQGPYYYLFVNWGRCCRGTNSTYEVRVGRSAVVTGPYQDRSGVDLVNRGGTPFLESNGRFVGLGHIGVMAAGGQVWFSYHDYDAASKGRSRLGLGQLEWTADGWPLARAPVGSDSAASTKGP